MPRQFESRNCNNFKLTHPTHENLPIQFKHNLKSFTMNIGVLGTGTVGTTIASALINNGHNVRMGSRTAANDKALAWVEKSNERGSQGDFNDAASFGEIVFLCLNGEHALEAVRTIEPVAVEGKIVIDVTNPLDFSQGMPPRLVEGLNNSNSLGEEIQKTLTGAKVVKGLNTVTANLMVNAKAINNGDHNLFICGNDNDAKNKVKQLLSTEFGWITENIIDLGSIQSARMMEAYVPFWVTIMQAVGTPMFNVRIVK
jgi:8-hydroxy-5-deazaflavin:NADPH oxidoreductase